MKDYLQLGLESLLLRARTDKDTLIALKNAAVSSQHYELAASFRSLEKELYPQTEEEKLAYSKAKEYETLFRMLGLSIDEPTSWLIGEAVSLLNENKGDVTLKETSALQSKFHKIFNIT